MTIKIEIFSAITFKRIKTKHLQVLTLVHISVHRSTISGTVLRGPSLHVTETLRNPSHFVALLLRAMRAATTFSPGASWTWRCGSWWWRWRASDSRRILVAFPLSVFAVRHLYPISGSGVVARSRSGRGFLYAPPSRRLLRQHREAGSARAGKRLILLFYIYIRVWNVRIIFDDQ